MPSRSRVEYLARIHRAQDLIERRLSEPLTLEEIARAASFSPFHFHRVFSAITGETLYQFVLRVRLEKAATQLLQNPDKSITSIALDCGFSSSATFARAFRAWSGMSASDWRSSGGVRKADDRKICKTVRNDRKDLCEGAPYDDGIPRTEPVGSVSDAKRSLTMSVSAQSAVVNHVDAMTVAYLRHIGPYAGDNALFGRLFGKLMAWAGPRGLAGPNAKTLIIYHDNPNVTEPEKLRISLCLVVPKGTTTEGEVGLLDVPAGACARAKFEIDPRQYGEAWQWVMAEWLPETGYQPDDRPCYELHLNNPETHPEHKHIFEIVMPVKPL